MPTVREAIDAIMVDCYDDYEAMAAWEVTFDDEVAVPFETTFLDMPVQVTGFRLSDAEAMQCQVVRNGKTGRIPVEELPDEGLPDDMRYVLSLYKAYLSGDY